MESKLNSGHIWWKVHKTKVADSLEFLGHDLEDTKLVAHQILNSYIEFIRNIDWLSNFLNSSYPFEEVLKAPISNFNLTLHKNADEIFCKYLLTLKDASNQLLYFHRGQTFILVFVCIA